MCMYKNICITNRKLVKGDFLEQVRKVAGLGADALILREKDLEEQEYEVLARKVLAVCSETSVVCILHSFPETARKLNHPYIHLPMSRFLELGGQEKRWFRQIGVSTHTVEEAVKAEKLGADYITASHIFPTACKPGAEPRGLSYLEEVCRSVRIPVYALGGIHPDKAELCIQAGAAGICMMSEYMKL